MASRRLEFLLYLRYLLLFSPEPELLRHIIDHCRKSSVNVVWLDRHEYSFILARQLTRIFKDQRLNVRVVLDTAAVHSDFIGRGLNFQLNSCTRRFVQAESALFRRLETSMSESCDLITAVSDEDRKIFSTFQHTQTPILLFPNVIDPDFYNVGEQYCEDEPTSFNIIFTGSFYNSTSPMVHGGQWFLDNVIPKIISTGLPINTTYLGRGASSHFQSNAGLNLTIIDEVPYVQPYLTSSDLGIVPCFMSQEQGSRFWNMESNLPNVPTTLGQRVLT